MKDRRRPPFAFQELSATRAIREAYSGQKRMAALAIYQSMTEIANEHRARVGGHDEPFEAARREIADHAGCSPDTVDRYCAAFEELGILDVERRQERGVWLPSLYTLLTPGDDANAGSGGSRTSAGTPRTSAATPSRTSAGTGSRTSAAVVNQEEASTRLQGRRPPGGEAKSASPRTNAERRRARTRERLSV